MYPISSAAAVALFNWASAAANSLRLLAGTGATMLRVHSTGLAAGGDLAMGSHKVSGLAASTVAGDAVRHEDSRLSEEKRGVPAHWEPSLCGEE